MINITGGLFSFVTSGDCRVLSPDHSIEAIKLYNQQRKFLIEFKGVYLSVFNINGKPAFSSKVFIIIIFYLTIRS